MTSAPHNRPQGARTLYDAQRNRVAVAASHFAAGGAGTVHRIAGHRPGLLGRLLRLPELIWGAPPKPQSRLERHQPHTRHLPPDDKPD